MIRLSGVGGVGRTTILQFGLNTNANERPSAFCRALFCQSVVCRLSVGAVEEGLYEAENINGAIYENDENNLSI